jgi:hypothetical protein
MVKKNPAGIFELRSGQKEHVDAQKKMQLTNQLN